MIKIPKKINVAGFEVEVIMDKHLGHEEGLFGNYSQCHDRIKLDSTCKPYRMVQAFYHETCEAINNTFDLKMQHHQIEMMATGLAQALKDIEVE